MNLYFPLFVRLSDIFVIIPMLLVLALPIWAMIDMFKMNSREAVRLNPIWVLIVLFFPIIGSVIYFQLGKKYMLKNKRVFNPDFNTATKR
jgi:CDP-diglyceride synthetase